MPSPGFDPDQHRSVARLVLLQSRGKLEAVAGNDAVVAAPEVIADCEARLAAAGIRYKAAELPTRKAKEGHECGAPQVVVYRGPEGGVRWSSAPLVTCGMALALARFESILQEESEKYFQKRVVRIEHLGTYACREMARYDWVSEHSYANAIDIRSVTLKNGRTLTVLGTFGKLDAEPKRPEARFWRSVANRLFDEGAFSVVLTPFFDPLHRDHLHLDQARYRIDGTRP